MRSAVASLTIAIAIVAPEVRADLWTATTPPTANREGASLTALPDGRFLLAGGRSESITPTTEIFDPKTNTWSAGPSMSIARWKHGAVRLADGRIAVIGGLDSAGGAQRSVEILADGKWTTAASAADGVTAPVAVGADGKIAASSASTYSFHLYDPVANTWFSAPKMRFAHTQYALAALPNGFGVFDAQAERYNATAGTWSDIRGAGNATTAVALRDGRVLIVGTFVQLFDPKAETYTSIPDATARSAEARAVELPNGRVVLYGGSNIVEVFDPKTNAILRVGSTSVLGSVNMLAVSESKVFVASASPSFAGYLAIPAGCSAATDCASGYCVDGFCCDSACNGQCEACDVPNSLGICTAVRGGPHGTRATCSPPWTSACRASTCDGVTREKCVGPPAGVPCDCSKDSDCDSGFCTDGVCCNTRCAGQCEACDLPETRGTCRPVVGEPRGIRKGCPAAGALICTVQACDGVTPDHCVYSHKQETNCDSICGGRVYRHCDGQGQCGLANELKCPNDTCSAATPEPAARPRFIDALIVLGALGLIRKRVRAWRGAPRPSCPPRDT